MRILVTNDDGIHSPGLWTVADALTDVGEVVVAAPDRDQSGVGGGFTLLSVVRVQEITPPAEGMRCFSVEGTPADCVILATEALIEEPFDLVVSGINQGSNLGLDILNSGTVGGAFQGYFRNIPTVAVSVASLTDVRFESACQATVALARAVSKNSLPTSSWLNVNLPNVPPERIEGVEITGLGTRPYMENVERGNDGRRTHYWIKHNRPVNAPAVEGTDTWAVRNNRVSITPLDLFFTAGKPAPTLGLLADEVAIGLGLGRRG